MRRERALWIAAAAGTAVAARAVYRKRSDTSIRGQVALITGGSRGPGLSLAREFSREQCATAICARAAAELERARRDLETRGAQVFAGVCDVACRGQVGRFIDEVLAQAAESR